MEGLHEMGPPPFLTKLLRWWMILVQMILFLGAEEDRVLLYGILMLFLQGFRKIDPDKWEFANESFLRGQKHNLKNIRRRKAISQPLIPSNSQQSIGPCVEVGRFGLDAEIDSLRRDKQILLTELVKLRQQQQNTRSYLQQMELRLIGTEKKQQQMMSFLARAMQNPDFIHQLVQQKEKRKELEEAITKKRRRPIEAGESSRAEIKAEPLEFGEPNYGYQVSELEALALEMQGFGRAKWESEVERLGNYDKDLDEGFWEELLNEGFDKELGIGKDDEEDVDVLADRLGFLGSSPK
ncbi:hypothetical protein DH2020_024883 [Rehmannia glutinosa]|uniref:HSF-type DNA-binding domain-containing protein n=1 Tax=Rehmannia glutinosa TaxID=99300 RepID=A0ABR0W176_REHGL